MTILEEDDRRGNVRDAYPPRNPEARLHRYAADQSLADDDPLPLSRRWIQQCVKQAAENAYETTGNDDWLNVSSHDLRVYFVHTMLVEERVNPRVVMDVGGWDNYQSIKPYLGMPSEGNIIGEFERVGRE